MVGKWKAHTFAIPKQKRVFFTGKSKIKESIKLKLLPLKFGGENKRSYLCTPDEKREQKVKQKIFESLETAAINKVRLTHKY